MCTVSFIKSQGKVIITSNRDEQTSRPSAIAPKNYILGGKNVVYPKDPKAGGTWYAVDERGTVLVLLNGASEKHIIRSPYRKSRGLVVLELIASLSPKEFWNTIDLHNIEPFTMVLLLHDQLFQLQWDGSNKITQELDVNEKHIWSSSTLYPKDVRAYRVKLFNSFLQQKKWIAEEDMYQFHRYTDDENQENGFVINRNNELKTLSITQSVIQMDNVSIIHYDLLTQEKSTISFSIV
ncbi:MULTISPECIES: NRDE family protein [unclassified Flavobacterium]|uniref:NRDE family protein n=1 Tax=unclassified Flavobacterium TaxID=196869 RepID=UPI003F910626